VRIEQIVLIRHFEREVNVRLRHLFQVFALFEVLPYATRDPQQESTNEIVAVLETTVYRWSVGSGRAGNGPHGQGALSSSPPQPVSCFQYSFLQIRIRVPRHRSSCAQHYLRKISLTVYT
jgi:hypothetical protein